MRLKKGELYNGIAEKMDFPNKGRIRAVENEDGIEFVTVKNALPGQRVEYRLTKKSYGRAEGLLKSVIKPADCENADRCPKAGICGGCLYQGFPYEETLRIKEAQVKELLKGYIESPDTVYDGISASPLECGYRNKMEYTFGDEYRD
jgi:tRNA/tmRNA/rRNA uracil-C5-methylase (TrmA/RlmC/RlmD family)